MIDVSSVSTFISNQEELHEEFKYMWNLTFSGDTLVVLLTNFITNEFHIFSFNEKSLEDLVDFKILFTNKFPSEIVYSSISISDAF